MRASILIVLFARVALASTYYISKSAGDDTRTSVQAQSKSTPWAHLPGMAGCTTGCTNNKPANYTPQAGDTFILMGCDTWVNADLPVKWNWSGSSGSPITVTVDNTWYNTSACPANWNRPVWDAGGAALTSYNTNLGRNENVMLSVSESGEVSYGVFDNIEMKGLLFSADPDPLGQFIWLEQATVGFTFSNLYIHAWASTADNCIIIRGQAGNLFTAGVIDGSDGTGVAAGHSCFAFYPAPPSITNSVIRDVPNGIVGYAGGYSGVTTVTWGGNHIYNISTSYAGANHCNIMEIVGGGTYYIHDNVMHDINCAGGESMMIGNNGETSYIWNNVIYNLGPAQTPSMPQTANQTGISEYIWNNTIVSPGGQACINNSGQKGATFSNIYIQNNHCISAGAVVDTFSATNLATTPNVLQTPAAAAAQGYTAAQSYVYSPTSGGATIGQGTNLSANCSGSLAGLCSDTSYACTQQTIGGVVQSSCPARVAAARGATWDIGAYQYSAGGRGNWRGNRK